MSIKEVSAEQLAQLFHLYHEALATDLSGLRIDAHVPWSAIPQPERKRMIAAIRLALLDLGFAAKEPETPRQYFAEPGTAEWGC
jgi:hypothetical protein